MRWRIRGSGADSSGGSGTSGRGSGGSGGSGTDGRVSGDNRTGTGRIGNGRKRNAKRRAAAERGASDQQSAATTSRDAAAGHSTGDQRRETAVSWQKLGRLQPTAASVAPILAPLGLPELASTRSLIHRPRQAHAEPPTGTVLGIASVLPFYEPASEAVPVIASVSPFDEPPGTTVPGTSAPSFDELAGAAVVRTVPAVPFAEPASGPEHQGSVPEAGHPVVAPMPATDSRPERPLTHVTPEHVGEPREAAVPYRAPAWLRAAMPSSEFGGVTTPLDAFASPMSWSAPALPAAPEPPAPPAQRAARRPGLGAPLRPAQIKALRERAAKPEPEPESEIATEIEVAAAGEPVPPPAPQPRPHAVVRPLPSVPSVPNTPEPAHTLPDRFTATIPANLAATFERAHGFGVADVSVDRSPAASAEAERIGARAFTRGDLIVLPPEAGPAEAAAGLALLGHELTHVIQQRVLGSVPPETSEFGLELEAAAQATESWIRAGAAGPPPPVIPEPPAPLWRQPAPAYRAAGPAMTARSITSSGSGAVPGPVQRAAVGTIDAPARPAANAAATPIVVPTPPASAPGLPSLVHPAAAPSSNPDTPPSAYPRTEDELNQLIATGALDVYQSQQQPPAPEAPPYDRQQRRVELSISLLDRANTQRAERGEQPLTELPPELAAMIEMHLDEEQVAAMAAQSPALPSGRPDTTGPPGTPGIAGSGFRTGPRTGPGPQAAGPAPGPAPGTGFGTLPASWAGDSAAPSTPPSPPTSGPGAGSDPTPASAQTPPPDPPPAPHRDAPAGIEPADVPDLNDEQLTRLYERIKTRLRRELLVDRERTGQLMDFR